MFSSPAAEFILLSAPDTRELHPGVPPPLAELLQQMLVKERAQRLNMFSTCFPL